MNLISYKNNKRIKPENLVPLENPDILAIGKKYNKTAAQVILRWLVQIGIAVLPKSVTPSRIAQNVQARFEFKLRN